MIWTDNEERLTLHLDGSYQTKVNFGETPTTLIKRLLLRPLIRKFRMHSNNI